MLYILYSVHILFMNETILEKQTQIFCLKKFDLCQKSIQTLNKYFISCIQTRTIFRKLYYITIYHLFNCIKPTEVNEYFIPRTFHCFFYVCRYIGWPTATFRAGFPIFNWIDWIGDKYTLILIPNTYLDIFLEKKVPNIHSKTALIFLT